MVFVGNEIKLLYGGVAWTVTVSENGAAAVGEISYTVKAGGLKVVT
jgi:hypothetical protein